MDILTGDTLRSLLNESKEKAQKEALARAERKRVEHQAFLNELRHATLEWEAEFSAWIGETAFRMATVWMKDKMVLPAPWEFGQKYKIWRFRISTFVKQYRFDPAHFREAGFEKMPFQRIQDAFAERGIHVADVSDRNKGFGFHVLISF
jgi:hypothetical protein